MPRYMTTWISQLGKTEILARRQPRKNFTSDSLRLVSQLYDGLPEDPKKINSMTGDPQMD